MRRPAGAVLLCLPLIAGCAARATTPPITVPPRSSVRMEPACTAGPCSPMERLQADLAAALAEPGLYHGIFSVLVQSVASGETLFQLNPETLVVPASTMKVVTLAAAASRLGWDFRYETRLETAAPIAAGVLEGDLVVVGGGDPTINTRSGNRDAVFAEFAEALKSAGVSRIAGRVIGDDNAFDDVPFGDGWSWDDLVHGYAAPVGALQYNENLVQVIVRPGDVPGAAGVVELQPGMSGLVVDNHVATVAAPGTTDVNISRLPGQTTLQVYGSIPVGSGEEIVRAAVDNPTLFFVRALVEYLRASDIAVDGDAVDVDDTMPGEPSPAGARVLATHRSAPLAEVAQPLMKASQNLYAETLRKSISLVPGPASTHASEQVEEELLGEWGIAPAEYVAADGSGLSRLNLLSASVLVRILRRVARDPASFEPFARTLPIAGRDGTLAGRLKGTRAEGNAIAKTGTLSNVRALSGYVRSADGELLAFAMIANHYAAPTAAVDTVVDRAVERLANFSRR